jgi:uncharacterized protein
MARDLGCSVFDLMRNATLRKAIDPSRYITAEAGLPTLMDILSELARPGRDPRDAFEPFSFAPGIEKLADVKAGMKLPGIVTNVTAFGAFVDIGVHRDGLVHVSELSDNFVKDPRQVVHVHQQVTVAVLDVDMERGRVSLSMKSSSALKKEPISSAKPSSTKTRPEHKKPSAGKNAFNNPFEAALRKS